MSALDQMEQRDIEAEGQLKAAMDDMNATLDAIEDAIDPERWDGMS